METNNQLPGVTVGKIKKPVFALFCGVRGVGKTTLVSQAPNPIFLGLERGTFQVPVARFPKASTYEEFFAQVKLVRDQVHSYKSVVLDTVDALEPLIWKKVCVEGHVDSIGSYAGGYGNGYVRASEIWRELMGELEGLAGRLHVLLTGHVHVKTFQDPNQASGYDQYQLKLNERAIAAICEPLDLVGFCMFKTTLVRDKSSKETRAITDGERVMYTEFRPAFDCAKNRFNLPFELPLDWKMIGAKVQAFYAPPPAELPVKLETANV